MPDATEELTRFTPSKDGLLFSIEGEDSSAERKLAEQAIDLGYCEPIEDQGFLIPWRNVYRLLEDDDLGESRGSLLILLGLPDHEHVLSPVLRNRGSLDDAFTINIEGWGKPGTSGVEYLWRGLGSGPLLEIDGKVGLLPAKTWALLESLQEWQKVPEPERNGEAARKAWAKIREQALAAGSQLSPYLEKTVVISAETLKVEFTDVGKADLVQITPLIDGAPVQWLEKLDKSDRIRPIYRTTVDEREYEIVIEDDVKSVLSHLTSATSGRRYAAGKKAQRLLTNPYEVLGDGAPKVIDEGQVSDAVAKFDSNYHRFQFGGTPDSQFPYLVIHPLRDDLESNPAICQFDGEEDYGEFMRNIVAAIDRGERYFSGPRGLPLLLDELASAQIAVALEHFPMSEAADSLAATLDEAGLSSRQLPAAEILDLDSYAERVKKIDRLLPFGVMRVPNPVEIDWFGLDKEVNRSTPVVSLEVDGEKKDEKPGASPGGRDETAHDGSLSDGSALGQDKEEDRQSSVVDLTLDDLEQLSRHVDGAPDSSSPIPIPGSDLSIPASQGDAMLSALGRQPRFGLVEKDNVEVVSFQNLRTDPRVLKDYGQPDLPQSLAEDVSLLPHQQDGLAWLQHLWRLSAQDHCAGALLADDMGVGKTLQTLALIARARELHPNSPPALIVAPVSLLQNWAAEIRKFFKPDSLRNFILDSSYRNAWRVPKAAIPEEAREKGISTLLRSGWRGDADVIITNYETVRDYQFSICRDDWSIVVFDEAQKIKNPEAISTRAAKVLKADFRVVCTGTPVENSLTDIWCLFDTAVQPGLLGAANEFARSFERPIQRGDQSQRRELIEELRTKIDPQVLRRLKEDISENLPEKRFDTACLNIPMSQPQEARYRQLISEYEESRSRSALALLQELNRVNSDFSILPDEGRHRESADELASYNPKFRWLLKTLDGIQANQEKALVFVILKSVQRQLARHIQERYGIKVDILNGDSPVGSMKGEGRQEKIDNFSKQPGFQVMILSPIAGGVGLNIQAANHVIHYMRHWNPAKEDQATDRAFRIGQDKPVTVYTPIVRGNGFPSFDEGLNELLEAKRNLAKDMLEVRPEVTEAELAHKVVGIDVDEA